jgi:hypothetical protein
MPLAYIIWIKGPSSPVDPGYGRPGWSPVDPGYGVGRPPHIGGGPIMPPVYPTTGPIYGGGYPSHGLPSPGYPSGQPVPPGSPPVAGQLPTAPPGWVFVFVPGYCWTWAQLPAPPSGENKPVEPTEPVPEPK